MLVRTCVSRKSTHGTSGKWLEGISRIELAQSPLICGLPDDIALICLARVPRKYHTLLKCVSRRWRDLVSSEEWHAYRQKHKLMNPGFMPCAETSSSGFAVMCWIPTQQEDATDEVYSYDASTNRWSEAAPLSTARCYFACEVLNGKIYAIGGLGSKSNDPHSWDTYNPHTNSWKSHSDPNIVPDIEDSIVLDEKIYIRCGTSALTSHVYAVVYNPSHGTWQHADADMVLGWQGPAVVVDGILYVLDQRLGTRLMMWQKESRRKGLSTVVFDIGNAGNMGGLK
ncbi:F-box/kelch-repeat protein SKIP4 [Vitis vinifera]|uniref:F-box/kelch-repeat protein SKIP4 n=1 Tax=Vitis vinifera TaxID=29760 RepID=A0A438JLX6_VITVI|nr:F-box/kelch-repeat protein SKIP4 [Vitis vinifera]